jgi:hypothetical protein
MTDHLMRGHSSPTGPTAWMYLGESVEYFGPIAQASRDSSFGTILLGNLGGHFVFLWSRLDRRKATVQIHLSLSLGLDGYH